MAREIIQRTWCDPCLNLEDAEQNEGTEVVIAVGSAKPRVLAVCERHHKELVEPITHALTEYGVIEDRIKAKPGKAEGGFGTAPVSKWAYSCQYPGCEGGSKSEGGFSQHLYQHHNIGVVAYRQLVDGEVTLKDLGMKPYKPEVLADPLFCEAKGCAREFTGPNRKGGRSSHMNRSHPELVKE